MPKVVDRGAKREEIAKAARRVIAGNGIDGAKIRQIAREAHCSTGVLAHYFRDKDELLLFSLRQAWEDAARRIEEIVAGASGLDALRRVLEEALPLDAEREEVCRFWLNFWGRASSNRSLAEQQNEHYTQWRRLISALLLACRRESLITPDVDVEQEARSIVALVDGIGIQAAFEGDGFPPEEQTSILRGYLSRLTS